MNQYRHSKSSLFLMEIILNILFFSILATFCVQIFFKGYQLSENTKKLHQAVTACVSIAEICQSTDSPKEALSSIYPESSFLPSTSPFWIWKQLKQFMNFRSPAISRFP